MSIQVVREIIKKFTEDKGFYLNELIIKDFIAYKIDSDNLLDILKFLKESTDLRFTVLTDLFGADFPGREERFEIVYSLLSLKLNLRMLLKISCKEGFSPASINTIFKAANWYEREVFDMYGVTFKNNPDMRRILTDYGFVGHPLKKDFPVTGYLQVRYDEELQKVIYEPVKLDQEYRHFDFSSPWEGPKYILPGDEKAKKKSII